jgi:hypothetical protein
VRDQKVSMYYGAYTTKHSTDCENALFEAMLTIEKHEKKCANRNNKPTTRTNVTRENTKCRKTI